MTRPNIEAIQERIQVWYDGEIASLDFASTAAASDIPALLLYVSELEADSRRMDWLDSQRADVVEHGVWLDDVPRLICNAWGVHGMTENVREAIDAAITPASPSLVDTETKESVK